MSTQIDSILINKYRNMINLTNISCDNLDSNLLGSVTITSILNVKQNALFKNNVSTLSSVNVNGNALINNIYPVNNLNVSNVAKLNTVLVNSFFNFNNSTINNDTTINTNLNILGNFSSNYATILSSLNIIFK